LVRGVHENENRILKVDQKTRPGVSNAAKGGARECQYRPIWASFSSFTDGRFGTFSKSISRRSLTKWRRLESNEAIGCRNHFSDNDLQKAHQSATAFWQCVEIREWQDVTDGGTNADAALVHVIGAWKRLPPHIRESILTLVFAADIAFEHTQ